MQELQPIETVSQFLELIKENRKEENYHRYLRLWYRGEANKNWILKPKRFRPPSLIGADSGLNIERHLSQDFFTFTAGLRKGTETQADIYFLQQHYGMPTRLLDWTTNPLAALFFAVKDLKDEDGRIIRMNAYELSEKQKLNKTPYFFQGIATSRDNIFTDPLANILSWKPINEKLKYILPVRPDYSDTRITQQRSCFTFHGYNKSELTVNESDSLKYHVIPSNSKQSILENLSFLGIDDFSVFGDMEGLARTLQMRYGITK